jgi:EAL domain-containing protein (putative c-di-GMP-specific phosphodiesterase class I)
MNHTAYTYQYMMRRTEDGWRPSGAEIFASFNGVRGDGLATLAAEQHRTLFQRILRDAGALAEALPPQAMPCLFTVNLDPSAVEAFTPGGFVDMALLRAAASNLLDAGWLPCIEITERGDIRKGCAVLCAAARAAGFMIALDDVDLSCSRLAEFAAYDLGAPEVVKLAAAWLDNPAVLVSGLALLEHYFSSSHVVVEGVQTGSDLSMVQCVAAASRLSVQGFALHHPQRVEPAGTWARSSA